MGVIQRRSVAHSLFLFHAPRDRNAHAPHEVPQVITAPQVPQTSALHLGQGRFPWVYEDPRISSWVVGSSVNCVPISSKARCKYTLCTRIPARHHLLPKHSSGPTARYVTVTYTGTHFSCPLKFSDCDHHQVLWSSTQKQLKTKRDGGFTARLL